MSISQKLLNELSEKIELIAEASRILKTILFDFSPLQFLSVRFLVLSDDEAYLISPLIDSIFKIDNSLKELNFNKDDMKYISDIDPIFGPYHSDICVYIDSILESCIQIRYFCKVYFGLKDNSHKWDDNKVLLLFFVNELLVDNPFYVSLIYQFYQLVQFNDSWSYNDVYRLSEDAAILTLQKTLPITTSDLFKEHINFQEYQRKYVILELITRTINDISALYYESSPCKGFFQFIRNKQEFQGIELKNKINFYSANDRIIRKLLEAARSFPLVVLEDKIIGIATKQIVSSDKYTIHILGHLAWEYRINDIPQFVFMNSLYKFPSSRINKEKISDLFIDLFNLSNRKVDQFLHIIDYACNGHGAMIIITNNAKLESIRLCELNRGVLVRPFKIFNITEQIITDITSIDGAIILDPDGKCYAFGVILDGNAVIQGSPSRGARYNSAKNYISLKKQIECENKYMAVVISEDGMVNVFPDDYDNYNRNYFSYFQAFKE